MGNSLDWHGIDLLVAVLSIEQRPNELDIIRPDAIFTELHFNHGHMQRDPAARIRHGLSNMFMVNRRLVAIVVLLAACSRTGKPPVAAGTPDPAGSAAQDAALVDGKVTLGEYQAGFARWVQCAKDVGITIEAESTDPTSGLIQFRIYDPGRLEDPNNPAAKCYKANFEKVDHWFGANDPAVQAHTTEEQLAIYREVMVPCLTRNGEPAAGGAQPGDAEWVRVLARVAALQSAGKC